MITLLDLQKDELRPLRKEETVLLANIIITSRTVPETNQPQVLQKDKALLGMQEGSAESMPFLLKVLIQRLVVAGGEYSTGAIVFASSCTRTPGEAVMWAHALWTLAADGPVTLDTLLDNEPRSPFHYGIPTPEGYQRVWDAQKQAGAPLGNLLDSSNAWVREEAV